jgi:uncharacterized low-complexity protein
VIVTGDAKMIRSLSLCVALAAALSATGAAAQAVPGPAPKATQGPPTPIAASTAAGWTCRDGKCGYQKTQGAWSDCFTSWSPTHGGWLPTRYCR